MGPTLNKILKIKKQKKTKKNKSKGRILTDGVVQRKGDIFYFLFFSSFASLFDIRKSDRRNSSGKEI